MESAGRRFGTCALPASGSPKISSYLYLRCYLRFKYHPETLRKILFPQPKSSALLDSAAPGRSAKRRRLDSKSRAGTQTPTPPQAQPVEDIDFSPQRAVLVETTWESFLISRHSASHSASEKPDKEKENQVGGADTTAQAHRYTVTLLPEVGGAAGKLNKSQGFEEKAGTLETAPPTRASKTAASEPISQKSSAKNAATTADRTTQAEQTSTSSGPDAGGRNSKRGAPPSLSLPLTDSSEDEEGSLQVLHRDLGENSIQFADDGVVFVNDVVDGAHEGWKLEAKRWRWVQVDVASS